MYSSSPVIYRWVPCNVEIPFNRLQWDIFSLSLWDSMNLFGWTHVRDNHLYGLSGWPFGLDARKWSSLMIEPCWALFYPQRYIYPGEGDPDEETFVWDRDHPVPRPSRFTSSIAIFTGYLTKCFRLCKNRFRMNFTDDQLLGFYPPGKLGFKLEGSGKTRIFAIPNSIKQLLLRPAHDWCIRSCVSSLRMEPLLNLLHSAGFRKVAGCFDRMILHPQQMVFLWSFKG